MFLQDARISGGRPEDIAKAAENYTGQFLAGLLKRGPAKRIRSVKAPE
jgi:hypothetical protein